MKEDQAKAVAEALRGSAWNSGGGIWLVRMDRHDGSLVIISDEVICEYAGEEEFEVVNPANSIILH